MSKTEKQIVEIVGRNWLVNEILYAGWEVAFPVRDRGVDLIAYRDTDKKAGFRAVPIQLKARSGEDFGIDAKYGDFPRLLLVFVWNVDATDPERTTAYALTYGEALRLARERGWTEKSSWKKSGKFVQTRVSGPVREALRRYKMTRKKWSLLLERLSLP